MKKKTEGYHMANKTGGKVTSCRACGMPFYGRGDAVCPSCREFLRRQKLREKDFAKTVDRNKRKR
jgi:rubrerythrin